MTTKRNREEIPRKGDKLVFSGEDFALYRNGYIIQPYFYTFPLEPTNEKEVVDMGKVVAAEHKLKIGEVKGKYPFLILELKRSP